MTSSGFSDAAIAAAAVVAVVVQLFVARWLKGRSHLRPGLLGGALFLVGFAALMISILLIFGVTANPLSHEELSLFDLAFLPTLLAILSTVTLAAAVAVVSRLGSGPRRFALLVLAGCISALWPYWTFQWLFAGEVDVADVYAAAMVALGIAAAWSCRPTELSSDSATSAA